MFFQFVSKDSDPSKQGTWYCYKTKNGNIYGAWFSFGWPIWWIPKIKYKKSLGYFHGGIGFLFMCVGIGCCRRIL